MSVIVAPLTPDHNNNVSTSFKTIPLSGYSLTLIIIYTMLTSTALFIIIFLLLQLDVIFCRRPTFNIQSLRLFLTGCCQRLSVRSVWNAAKFKQRAGRLSMLTPLMMYVGVLDAFVSCEFTEVSASNQNQIKSNLIVKAIHAACIARL